MRIDPNPKYHGMPCSFVATGTAYEQIYKTPFEKELPDGLKDDGYLSLNDINKFIRDNLKVRKKEYYKRGARITLKEFLENNPHRCLVCVYGHFIYVDKKKYWSFFNNENDLIVCVWYLKGE